MTMMGIAVGLGNVWRFPYMMGQYGGSAFLCVYLLFAVIFGIPAVMAEWALGRYARGGPFVAFRAMWGKKVGLMIGLLLMATVFGAESYYVLVLANVAYTAAFSTFVGFSPEQMPVYEKYLAAPLVQYAIVLVLLLLSFIVLARGLNRGIEWVSRIFVPFFLITIGFLIFFVMRLPGAFTHLAEFMRPDFTSLTPEAIFAAMGQPFFSLGLGGTYLVIFGGYMKTDERLAGSAVMMAAGDVGAALMAGLFIVPAIMVFSLNMAAGPSLLFSVLPNLFQAMDWGQVIGSVFLWALVMVTFISNLAALEFLVVGIGDIAGDRLSRTQVLIIICAISAVLVMPNAADPDRIATLDLIFGSGMQVFGSMLAILAISWGLKKTDMLKAVFGDCHRGWHNVYYYWIKWVVPAALMSVLVGYIYSKI